MRRTTSRVGWAACVFLVLPIQAAGQGPARITITPHAGFYAPLAEMGAAAPASEPWYLRLDRADAVAALGVTAEVASPGRTVSLRLGGFTTLRSGAHGQFDCYPGIACPSILLTTDADITISGAMADAVWSPRGAAAVRPYALAGAGFKRYVISWPDAAVFVDRGNHSDNTPALHIGGGVNFDVFGTTFRAEVTDFWSGEGRAIRFTSIEGTLSAPGRRPQHDISVILGWSLLRF